MAREIRLASGTVITRVWDGQSFQFGLCVDEGENIIIFAPTPQEMLDIAALFRRAGLKMRTKAKERAREEYEAPTVTPLGKHAEGCSIRDGGNVCDCKYTWSP